MWGGSTGLNGLFMGIAVDCSKSEKEELLIPYTGSVVFPGQRIFPVGNTIC